MSLRISSQRFNVEPLEARILLSAEPVGAVGPAMTGLGGMTVESFLEVPASIANPVTNLENSGVNSESAFDPLAGMRESPQAALSGVVEAAQAGGQEWSGEIPNGTVWPAGVVQHVTSTAQVPAGSKLTIEPGAIVKFDQGHTLHVSGTLEAVGTAAAPIVFTSFRDDSIGGDTNKDGPSVGSPADWTGLEFLSGSTGNVLNGIEIRYAGFFFAPAAAILSSVPLGLTNSVIRDSMGGGLSVATGQEPITGNRFENISGPAIALTDSSAPVRDNLFLNTDFGLSLNSASPVVANNTFRNDSKAAIRMDLASHPAISSSVLENNAINGVQIDGGVLAEDTSWNNPEIVYVLDGNITVPLGKTLTVGPGQIIKAPRFRGLGFAINGRLLAQGAAQQPVIFTSLFDNSAGNNTTNDPTATPGKSDWNGFTFATGSGESLLDFVEVRYAGSGRAALINSGGLKLTNSVVTNSAGAGLEVIGSAYILVNDRFVNSDGPAILADLSSELSISGVSFDNNRVNGVVIQPGSLTRSLTWANRGVVFWLNGDVTIPAGLQLTLGAGQVLKSNSIVRVEGTLIAIGTAADPVVLTEQADDSAGGDTNNDGPSNASTSQTLRHIEFTNSSVGNRLEFFEYRSGGGILLKGAPLLISHSVIRANFSAGLRFEGSNPQISDTAFIGNQGPALSMDLNSKPRLSGLTLSNNAINGLALDGGTLPGDSSWDNPTVVYWVTGNIIVPQGSSLTVSPGQVVKFLPTDIHLAVEGKLTAAGRPDAPIIFTSGRDDSVAGDTNNDGSATSPSEGDWGFIELKPGSSGNLLQNVVVSFGGTFLAQALLVINGAEATITDSAFRHSSSAGIRVLRSNPVIAKSRFENNRQAAISADLQSSPIITEPLVSGNGVNALALDGGEIGANNGAWQNRGIVYWFAENITVPAGQALKLVPGLIMKFSAGRGLTVNGTLNAIGTAAEPIIFTAASDDSLGGDTVTNDPFVGTEPSNGFWKGIAFTQSSAGNIINHAEIRYGGNERGAVIIDGAGLTLSNALIRNSGTNGMRIANSNPLVRGTTFQENSGGAISMDLRSNPILNGIVLQNNGQNVLLLDAGTLPTVAFWDDTEIVYQLTGAVSVPANGTLTIAPGQIIKANTSNTFPTEDLLRVSGTLRAVGTALDPIIFTAVRDDSAAGDTDNQNFFGVVGGWRGLEFTATSRGSVLDHIDLRYAGAFSGGAFIVDGAEVALRNSIIRNSQNHAVLVRNGGKLDLTSNLIVHGGADGLHLESGAVVKAVNNTIDSNATGVSVDAGALQLINNLITLNQNRGVVVANNGSITMAFNDVFTDRNNPLYEGLPDQTGSNQNVSVDPRYSNNENFNYTLQAGSPVIDSASGGDAPATDFSDQGRFDDPNTVNTGGGPIVYVDLGAMERQAVSASEIDLAIQSVTLSALDLEKGIATLEWSVRNVGQEAAAGSWFDAVYLSQNTVFSPDDTFLGDFRHSGDVGSGQKYDGKLQVTLPVGLAGRFYFIVRANSRAEIFEGLNLGNNALATGNATDASIRTIQLDEVASDLFSGPGQDHYYKLTVASGLEGAVGRALVVAVDSAAVTGALELYIRRGTVPTRNEYDMKSEAGLQPDQDLAEPISANASDTYYILVHSRFGAAATGTYTLTARRSNLDVRQVSPNAGANRGKVTIVIQGTDFNSRTKFTLLGPNNSVLPATAIYFREGAPVSATFDLTSAPVGVYDLRVENGAATNTKSGAFTVNNGKPGELQVHLTAPEAIRGRRGIYELPVTVDYINSGGTDLVAPMLVLQADNANLRWPEDAGYAGSSVQFLALDPKAPPGILPPGAGGRASLLFRNSTIINGIVFHLRSAALGDVEVNWSELKDQLRPKSLDAGAWEAIWSNFVRAVGTSTASLQAKLIQDAGYLNQLGEFVQDIGRLLTFELEQAGLTEISNRYRMGSFGRGRSAPWEMTARTDTFGNVIVETAGVPRFFVFGSDGYYHGLTNDAATLTGSGGEFQLRELDGTVYNFKDGRWDYVQDTAGNRITAEYNGARLVGIVHSGGNRITIEYNGAGRVQQIDDQTNHKVIFEYDAAGEHLMRVIEPGGTTRYTYVTGAGAAREHAIASITFADGSHLFFQYDDQGRLLHQERDGGADAWTVNYDQFGQVAVANPLGAVTTISSFDFGRVALINGPLGQTTQFAYDANRNLTRLVSGGINRDFTYDAKNNLKTITDALGNVTKMTYDPDVNQLASLRDARGNVIDRTYDYHGNLSSISYPDGSVTRYAYDGTGHRTETTNRRGQTIDYAYDSNGRISRKTYPDGTELAYTYDQAGHLLSATDAQGSTKMEYDAADHLTRITYPNGKFLQFSYDGQGRRSRAVDQSGFALNYTYDSGARLSSVTDSSGVVLARYTYDAAGHATREEMGNGTTTSFQYDAAEQLTSLVTRAADGTVTDRFDYTYDVLGRRTSMTTLEGTWHYAYDVLGQLTSVETPSGRNITYQYDAVGNRIASSDGPVQTAYAANTLNEYTAVGSAKYFYDADGNLVSKSEGSLRWNYTYDLENRLIAATTPEGSWVYEYDVLGNLAAVVHNGERIEYLTDPSGIGNVMAEYNSAGGLVAHYAHGLGLASRIPAAGVGSTNAYYTFDGSGNTSSLVDAAGHILNHYSFLPFGETLNKVESVRNPFTFSGQFGVLDQGAGLYSMRNRSYDPSLGRFTSPDPLGTSAGDANLYRYVGNAPTGNIDPNGSAIIAVVYGVAAFYAFSLGLLSPALSTTDTQAETLINQTLDRNRNNEAAALVEIIDLRNGYSNHQTKQMFWGDPNYVAADHYFTGVDAGRGIFKPWTIVTGGKGAWINTRDYLANWGIVLGSPFYDLAKKIPIINRIPILANSSPPSWKAFKYGILGSLDGLKVGFVDLITLPVRLVLSFDPNEKIGPAGTGDAKFIANDSTLFYRIEFENDPKKATAPAQNVSITDKLDADLDWTTLELGQFGFGSHQIDLPAGRQDFETAVETTNQDGSLLWVRFKGSIDAETGVVTWSFSSIDPATGQSPSDPLAGFLPVDDSNHVGEGYVTFRIRPRGDLPHATRIENAATIVFDENPALNTNTVVNTIDRRAPLIRGTLVNGPSAQRSDIQKIILNFDEDTGVIVQPEALQLRNRSTGAVVASALPGITYDSQTQQATVDLSGLTLTDGDYSLAIKAAEVRDLGNLPLDRDYSVPFHVLRGDANGDRVTNDLDLFRVWQALLQPANARDLNQDLNGDGQVTTADLDVVKGNYLHALPAPAPSVAAAVLPRPPAQGLQYWMAPEPLPAWQSASLFHYNHIYSLFGAGSSHSSSSTLSQI